MPSQPTGKPPTPADDLRTVAFVGHAGVGKTSLIEAMLAAAGAIPTAGSIERGNTVCDYDPLEKEHGHSLKLACAHFERDGTRVHLIDTPGYPDFAGRALAALDAVESVAVVVDAQRGAGMSTARMALLAQTRHLCRFIVVHRIDAEDTDLSARLEELRSTFGPECLPLNLPADAGKRVIDCFFAPDDTPTDFSSVAQAHQALVEQVVEVDDALTERYLSGEELAAHELHDAFERALRDGHIVPVLFASARNGAGVNELIDFVVRLAPSPLEGNPSLFERWPEGDPERAEPILASQRAEDHVLAHVFKIEIDPYVGRIAMVRVHQGTITPDTMLYVGEGRKAARAGALQLAQGREFKPLAAAGPGEICTLTKIDELVYDAVLHDVVEDATIHYRPLPLPHAVYGLAIRPKKRGDEQKLSEVLHRLRAEDPSLGVEHDPTTHEAVVRGLGEVHISRVLERIRAQYKLEVDAHPPTVPYRETISGSADGHHRHKKQSGGAGQFGEVFLRIEPLPRGKGFHFVDAVKGGTIPSVFIPAVEKGVRQALDGGAIAGFPVQDVQVTVYDGKTHPVDGKEIAFITAGRKAFLDAAANARPIVLEPIVALELTIPADAIGAVSGELSARRGQVLSADSARTSMATIDARAPLAELGDFQGRLKALTGGQGSYSLEFLGYEEAPPQVQQKLRTAWRPREEE